MRERGRGSGRCRRRGKRRGTRRRGVRVRVPGTITVAVTVHKFGASLLLPAGCWPWVTAPTPAGIERIIVKGATRWVKASGIHGRVGIEIPFRPSW